jgi:RNA polymerase sigma-70 factor (ECF subfamily)
MKVEDQFYIDKVLAGQTASYTFLIERYKSMVFTIAMKIVRNREDAEEVAQDCFIKAYQKLETYKGESKFSTWLYSIVYRTAISRIRKKQIELSDISDKMYKIPEDSVDPLELMKYEEQREFVGKAINLLPEMDAALVTLYYLNDSSVEEIEQITGLSNSNVKTKLFRARKKMYDILQVMLNEEMKSIA